MHALSEFGELRRRALAPEKVATQFRLELLDGVSEGWVTLHSSAPRAKFSVRLTATK